MPTRARSGENMAHATTRTGKVSIAVGTDLRTDLAVVAPGRAAVFQGGIAAGNFWEGFVRGGIVAGLNHALHNSLDDPQYVYNGETYSSEEELFFAILADQAAEQLGIQDVAAVMGILGGQPFLSKRFVTPGSSPGTSVFSTVLSKRMGTSPARLPTLVANSKRVGIVWTKSIGKFTSRAIPFIGWGILAYDISTILYNTQQAYSQIVNASYRRK